VRVVCWCMRHCKLILLLSSLLAVVYVEPACSRHDQGNSGQTSEPARGGSADPGGGNVSGSTAPTLTGRTMEFENPPLTDISQIFSLTNPNPQALWTRPVDLTGVTVQEVLPSKQFILIGSDKQDSMLVQVGGAHVELKPGQKVDLKGVIDPLGKDKSQWNVGPEEMQVLNQHTMFISANSIQTATNQ